MFTLCDPTQNTPQYRLTSGGLTDVLVLDLLFQLLNNAYSHRELGEVV